MKSFNYGRIGNFSKKCSYPKKEDSDDEESCCHNKDKKSKTMYKRKLKKNKKNFYSKEDSEDEDISEYVEVLIMGFESEISEEKKSKMDIIFRIIDMIFFL